MAEQMLNAPMLADVIEPNDGRHYIVLKEAGALRAGDEVVMMMSPTYENLFVRVFDLTIHAIQFDDEYVLVCPIKAHTNGLSGEEFKAVLAIRRKNLNDEMRERFEASAGGNANPPARKEPTMFIETAVQVLQRLVVNLNDVAMHYEGKPIRMQFFRPADQIGALEVAVDALRKDIAELQDGDVKHALKEKAQRFFQERDASKYDATDLHASPEATAANKIIAAVRLCL